MSLSAEQCKTAGNACMQQGDYSGAVDNYKRGLSLDPKNPILNCNLSQAYLNLENFPDAEKYAKVAIEQQDNYVKAYYRAARAAKECHNVYGSMAYLAQGVQKCASEELEKLYFLAREFSQEFEDVLRKFRGKEDSKGAGSVSSEASKQKQGTSCEKVTPAKAKSIEESVKAKNNKKAVNNKSDNARGQVSKTENEDSKTLQETKTENRTILEKKDKKSGEQQVQCKSKEGKEDNAKETSKSCKTITQLLDKAQNEYAKDGEKTEKDFEQIVELKGKTEEKTKQRSMKEEVIKKCKKDKKLMPIFQKEKEQKLTVEEELNQKLKEEEEFDQLLKIEEELKQKLREEEEYAQILKAEEELKKTLREEGEELDRKLKEEEEFDQLLKIEEELKQKLKEENEFEQKFKEEEDFEQYVKEEEEFEQKIKEAEEFEQNLKEEKEEFEQNLKVEEELKKKLLKEEILKQKLKEADDLKPKLREEGELKQKLKAEEELKQKLKADKELKQKLTEEDSKRKLKEVEELKLTLQREQELKLNQKLKKEERMKIKLKKQEELKLQLKNEEEKTIKVKELQSIMQEGTYALMKGLYRKAVDNLKKALDFFHSEPLLEALRSGDEMDIVVLHFALSQALILAGEYNDIVRAIEILEMIEKKGKHRKFPAIFLLLGRAYVRLNRFKNAQPPLERGLLILSRGTSVARYSWPGTYDVIDFTDHKILQDSLQHEIQMCKIFHKPDAVCFYEKCLETSHHIVPSRDIYFSDPDFAGFVDISCEEHCHVYYHVWCWKNFKEQLSEVGKLCEKDFLGRECFTPDCRKTRVLNTRAVISKVTIVGPDGEEKSSCEHAASLPSISLSNKEKVSVPKSPKKKLRRRDVDIKDGDKPDRTNVKRTRKDSKSRADSPSASPPPQNIEGYCKDALLKLAVARKNKFGYDCGAASPFNISSSTPILDKNEEFVYSYFNEIFKEEGFMSIFTLQVHWETNKELLPDLNPALITHTDLVKFLLDTGRFAVVQDMIGIASELPKMSAIIESKCEAPHPGVYEWQPSAATLLETQQTLSYSSVVKDSEAGGEEADSMVKDVTQYVYGHMDYYSGYEGSSSGSRRYLHFNKEVDLKEDCKFRPPIKPEKMPQASNFDRNCSDYQLAAESLQTKLCLPQNVFPPNLPKTVVDCDSPQELQSKDTPNDEYSCGNFNTAEKSVKESEFSSNDLISTEPRNLETICTDVKLPLQNTEQDNDLAQAGHNRNVQQLSEQTVQPVIQKPEKTEWKPRAKLLKWACSVFPGESEAKLWEALTQVRARNNYSLSGLQFAIIAEQVQAVLSEC